MPVTPSFTGNFNFDSQSADFGKLVLIDTNPYAAAGYTPANVKGIFKITNPAGVVFYQGDVTYSSPDTNGSGTPDWVHKQSIPMISATGYMLGDYVIEYSIKIAGEPDEYYSTSVTYTLAPPETVIDPISGEIQDGVLTSELQCFCRQIILTDETDYGLTTTKTRLITLHPPSIAGAPDATTSNLSLTYVFNVNYASYEYHLNTLVTYVTGAITVTVRITAHQYQIVRCNKLSALLMDCYSRYAQAFFDTISDNGGKIDLSWFSDLLQLNTYLLKYTADMQIGNWSAVDATYDFMTALIAKRITCPCTCDDQTEATLIDPYCGVGGSGTSYTFLSDGIVTVSVVGTVVTYGLSAAYTSKIDSLLIDALSSPDASVTISASVVGSTKTWSLSVKNHLAFNVKITNTVSGFDLTVTSSDVVKQGTRYASGFPVLNTDIQMSGYPHASLALLDATYAVLYIKNFLASAPGGGADVPDKIDVDIRSLLRPAATETDYSQPNPYRLELQHSDNTGIYVRFLNIYGYPVTISEFRANVQECMLTVKINQ